MVLFLFLGSLVTLELILRADSRVGRRSNQNRALPQSLPLPLPEVAGSTGNSMLALMQAVEQHGSSVQPGVQDQTEVKQTAEC